MRRVSWQNTTLQKYTDLNPGVFLREPVETSKGFFTVRLGTIEEGNLYKSECLVHLSRAAVQHCPEITFPAKTANTVTQAVLSLYANGRTTGIVLNFISETELDVDKFQKALSTSEDDFAKPNIEVDQNSWLMMVLITQC